MTVDYLEKEIICIIRRNRNIAFLTWAIAILTQRERMMM